MYRNSLDDLLDDITNTIEDKPTPSPCMKKDSPIQSVKKKKCQNPMIGTEQS